MSAFEERKAIHQVFADNWVNGGSPLTPVAKENEVFEPIAGTEWVRISIQNGDAFQLTIGSTENDHRHPGVVFVQVFTPEGEGDGRGVVLADQVAAIFRVNRQVLTGTVGRIVFRTATIRRVGVDRGFYQVNCVIPFIRDTLA